MRNSDKHLSWLQQELPQWVQQGLIPQESASRLEAHYGLGQLPRRQTLLTVFAMLGAVLIGIGIILLLAYNWSDFSRPLRTAIALGLLLSAQLLVGWGLVRHPDSAAWKEGGASFVVLALGASMALVSQTYHIPGDLREFLLTWSLLSLPLVYLVQATLPGVLYLAGILAWYLHGLDSPQAPDLLFWGLLLLSLPWLLHLLRQDRQQPAAQFLLSALALVTAVGFCVTLSDTWLKSNWVLLLSGLSAVYYLAGSLLFDPNLRWHHNALRSLGSGGILLLSFALSTHWVWRELLEASEALPADFAWGSLTYLADQLWILLLPLAWLGAMLLTWREEAWRRLIWGGLPLLAGICLLFAHSNGLWLGLLLANLYLLALGVSSIMGGVQARNPGQASTGTLILALLILFRFMDVDLGLLGRGVAFILVGICFLVANLWLMRYLRQTEAQP